MESSDKDDYISPGSLHDFISKKLSCREWKICDFRVCNIPHRLYTLDDSLNI